MPRTWRLPGRSYDFPPGARALVLGVLNLTPDSFSDGDPDLTAGAAVERALKMVEDGADLIDLGAESTRPGSDPVPPEVQLARLLPVVRALARQTPAPLSIDTTRPEVFAACFDAGAAVVNDISGMTDHPAMTGVVARTGAAAVVMHKQGSPKTMQLAPSYGDVVGEIDAYFAERLGTLADAGIDPERIALDPGIGFGKTLGHNLTLLAKLGAFRRHGRPVCLGVSRKGFLGTITSRAVAGRACASALAAMPGLARDWVQVLRAHDIAESRDAALLAEAIARHE